VGSDGFLPDRTLVLDLADAEASARAHARDGGEADRIGGRNPGFHRQVVDAFRWFAADEPSRIRLVDASGAEEQVTDRLLAALADMLP
jgi:dTMP kinase